MRLFRFAVTAAVVATVLALAGGSATAADSPLVGTWKTSIYLLPNEMSVFLVKVTEKDGKLEGKVINSSVPQFSKAEVEEIKADDKALTLKIKGSDMGPDFKFSFTRGKDDKKMLGAVDFGRGPMFAQLGKTEDTEIKQADAQKPLEGFGELRNAAQNKDPKEKVQALKEIVDKTGDSPLNYLSRMELITALAATGASAEMIKGEVDKAVKVAEGYDASLKAATLEQALANEAKGLKAFVAALKKESKTEELKAVEPRLAKIEKDMDDAYLKTAIPFKPEAFKGRKGKSDRVVVYELFTGSECPPCVSADVAFDALTESYKPTDVIFLQYHMHIPGPDALTTKASEQRGGKYYEIGGTPAAYVNGKEAEPQGGSKGMAEDRFKSMVKAFAPELEKDALAKLKLSATKKGDDLDIVAEASDVKDPGEDVKLRVVLVEDVVRYPGGNGQRFHHHVVRAFPGGVEGLVLKEATGKQNVKINLKDLAKELTEYLDEYAKKRPFRIEDRPLDLKKLKVVAFVQNDKTKEIYQAAQVDVE